MGSLQRCTILESIFRLNSLLCSLIFDFYSNLDGRDHFSENRLFTGMCVSFFQDKLFELDLLDVREFEDFSEFRILLASDREEFKF